MQSNEQLVSLYHQLFNKTRQLELLEDTCNSLKEKIDQLQHQLAKLTNLQAEDDQQASAGQQASGYRQEEDDRKTKDDWKVEDDQQAKDDWQTEDVQQAGETTQKAIVKRKNQHKSDHITEDQSYTEPEQIQNSDLAEIHVIQQQQPEIIPLDSTWDMECKAKGTIIEDYPYEVIWKLYSKVKILLHTIEVKDDQLEKKEQRLQDSEELVKQLLEERDTHRVHSKSVR